MDDAGPVRCRWLHVVVLPRGGLEQLGPVPRESVGDISARRRISRRGLEVEQPTRASVKTTAAYHENVCTSEVSSQIGIEC